MSKLIILVGILIFLCAGIFLTLRHFSASPAPVVNQGQQFPVGGDATSTMVEKGKMTLRTHDGKHIIVKDFVHNGETTPDVVNPGDYVLAGSLGYCLANGACPSGAVSTGYRIAFDEKHQLFSVLLVSEPLTENRLAAEKFLLERLGIEQQALCGLESWVGVTSQVNSIFAGRNLGFSFCPGAVTL